jgi:hypothetical protein
VAQHSLSKYFAYFFGKLNPSRTFEQKASAHYAAVKGLIEDRSSLASVLAPTCFLQGSYRNETATYTMNDVDIVALCELWQPGSGSGSGWSRDEIFDTVAAPLTNDWRYKNEVRYDGQSMCIKLDVEPRIEILPVVYKSGNADPAVEPFRLYRPENRQWEDGYARYHRQWISYKNRATNTASNFVPAIKVLKHLRTRFGLDAVPFHKECLLFSFPDNLFLGGPADYIPNLLEYITSISATSWYGKVLRTPCQDRDIFVLSEWNRESWNTFHDHCTTWHKCAVLASQAHDAEDAIRYWQLLLSEDFFPKRVS